MCGAGGGIGAINSSPSPRAIPLGMGLQIARIYVSEASISFTLIICRAYFMA